MGVAGAVAGVVACAVLWRWCVARIDVCVGDGKKARRGGGRTMLKEDKKRARGVGTRTFNPRHAIVTLGPRTAGPSKHTRPATDSFYEAHILRTDIGRCGAGNVVALDHLHLTPHSPLATLANQPTRKND